MKRVVVGLIFVALGACSPDAPSADGTGAEAGSTPAAGGTSAGELPRAEAVTFQVFDETVEATPPRRVTFHVLVNRDASRDDLRETLREALEQETARDTLLVAARAIAYYGVQTGATEADLLPFAWAEWLPTEGWYDATEGSLESLHRFYFYPETPPQW